jgi:hypothetical protein
MRVTPKKSLRDLRQKKNSVEKKRKKKLHELHQKRRVALFSTIELRFPPHLGLDNKKWVLEHRAASLFGDARGFSFLPIKTP